MMQPSMTKEDFDGAVDAFNDMDRDGLWEEGASPVVLLAAWTDEVRGTIHHGVDQEVAR